MAIVLFSSFTLSATHQTAEYFGVLQPLITQPLPQSISNIPTFSPLFQIVHALLQLSHLLHPYLVLEPLLLTKCNILCAFQPLRQRFGGFLAHLFGSLRKCKQLVLYKSIDFALGQYLFEIRRCDRIYKIVGIQLTNALLHTRSCAAFAGFSGSYSTVHRGYIRGRHFVALQ